MTFDEYCAGAGEFAPVLRAHPELSAALLAGSRRAATYLHCAHCMGSFGRNSYARHCRSVSCPLFFYRRGISAAPNRARKVQIDGKLTTLPAEITLPFGAYLAAIPANSVYADLLARYPARGAAVLAGSRPIALRLHCLCCVGGGFAEITRCTAGAECALYFFRSGKNEAPNRVRAEKRARISLAPAAASGYNEMPEAVRKLLGLAESDEDGDAVDATDDLWRAE